MAVTLLVREGHEERLAFTVSPLAELGSCLHVLAEPGHHGGLLAWAERIRGQFDDGLQRDFDGFVFLWRAYRANFLLPQRPGRVGEFDDELYDLTALSAERFLDEALQPLRGGLPREQVKDDHRHEDVRERVRGYARSRGTQVARRVDELLEDPAAVRERLSAFLRRCWDTFFHAEWTRLRPMLVADAQEKSDLVRVHGVFAALAALAPGIAVDHAAGRVVIDKVHHGTIDTAQRELQLLPTVFGWPHVLVQDAPDWPASVQYPARHARPEGPGIDLATVERRLSALADPSRLRLCRSIVREGRSTQELADIWGMTPPTVSRHLKLLRDAGLVTTSRSGHYVLYRLDVDVVWSVGPDLLAAILR